MPKWVPNKIWDGEEVFIIGGGVSLKAFKWDLLKEELTIGCNDAYIHGEEVCKLCVFGDHKWFLVHERALAHYKGVVVTNASQLYKSDVEWLLWMYREQYGLHTDKLGWNACTGAVAINLALVLGAKKVYLLGFDMHKTEGKTNWYDNFIDRKQPDTNYDRFINDGFSKFPKELESKFPEVKVINITDNSSLNMFPKIGVKEFWDERIKNE